MLSENENSWSGANQRYLMACLKEVREELESLTASKSKNREIPAPKNGQKAHHEIDKAAAELEAPSALDTLINILNLTSFERKLLLLCAGVELDAEFSTLIAAIQGDTSLLYPSFSLAWMAFPDAHWSAIAPGAPLRYWQLIKLKTDQVLTKSPIRIDEQVLHYLTGVSYMDERLREIVEPVQPLRFSVPSQTDLVNDVFHSCTVNNGQTVLPLLQLSGRNIIDKPFIAVAAVTKVGFQLYAASATAIPANAIEAGELARLWNREAALNGYALFLDCAKVDEGDKQFVRVLTSFIENIRGILILGVDVWKPELKRMPTEFIVPKPSAYEQKNLWEASLGPGEKDSDELLKNIVAQFNMSAGAIERIGKEVQVRLKKNSVESDSDSLQPILWKTCCVHSRPTASVLAQRIETVTDWDDLILPEAQKSILQQIALQIKHRTKVYEDWGFSEKSSRGLGISALFTGESGTGKTMASEVLAAELQLDLYRIDLSQVVNKYIGETEKNLKQIFDAAEDGGAILLFDEADALFGKRSDVKDSHDRYSNIEVSYLLQRMEAYRGLAILTTNMKMAIDKAFLRRIRFVVHFPYPDSVLRSEIWRHIFPAGTPVQNLDMEKLAKLNIPGGNIRNIAVNAAFLAADEGQPVQMNHIAKAVRSEYNKIEKALSNAELGGWQ